MLTTLRISGFAVVEEVEVRLGPGLNVLTGETGAGKSLLVNALHLVLGGRTGAEVLRGGAEEAVVEALFELPPGHPAWARLEAAGLPQAAPGAEGEGELLVRRVVPRSGRGRVFVNGSLCTAAILGEALRGVVDVTGQHEHVSLLDEGTHLGLLDAFAGVAGPGGARERYGSEFEALSALAREERALALDEEERGRRAEYLAFQLRELDALDPQPGEDAALERERKVLGGAARLAAAARSAEGLAYGEEGSASERVGQAVRALGEVLSLDPALEGPMGLLRSAAAEVEEAGRELSRYAKGLPSDPDRLEQVEERLAALRAAVRKHGGSLEAALARRAEMRSELGALSGSAERRAELARARERQGERTAGVAAELTRERQRGARAFCRAVAEELEKLAMARCRLEVCFRPPEGGVEVGGARLCAAGAETAEIRIAPNPGEPPRSLSQVASGGELSRVLLAVKRALSRADPVSCYVFDEVDAGIGGAVAEAVGRTLAEVARDRQVVCVTHLPQVAAFADRHSRVEKRLAGGRAATAVVALEDPEERVAELARMLAGQVVTRSARDHARELLAGARAAREGALPVRAASSGRAAGRRAAVA